MRPKGDLTRITGGPEALLDAIVKLEPETNMLLDLTGVNEIDAFGFNKALTGFQYITGSGRQFKLLDKPGQPRELFQLTNLEMLIKIHDSESAALAAFDPPRPNMIMPQHPITPQTATL
jgi:anti-anti-sigma regulatory factor